MTYKLQHIILLALFSGLLPGGLHSQMGQSQQNPVVIPAGSFHSVLPEAEGVPNKVESFNLDETAVTNEQFLEFLKVNPSW